MLQQTSNALDRFTARLASIIRWSALLMVVITLGVVVMRYAFDSGAIAFQESVMYLHGALFLLGIPYALQTNAHVRVDMLYARLQPKHQATIDLIGHCIFLLPVAMFILLTSLPYVAASWRVLEGSAEVGGIPAVFVLKTLIPVMAALLLIQGASEIIKCVRVIKGQGR